MPNLPLLKTTIDPRQVRDISSMLLDPTGALRTVAASVYAGTTLHERALFGVRHGLYGFLTTELVEFLATFIDGRSALEIGAGHGGLAAALGVRATDNWQQEDPAIKAYYEALQQPTVRYGSNVEKLDAHAGLAKYQPQVVVASWVTHKYDPARHEAGGNQDGVTEEKIISSCDAYVFIGNEKVHAAKSIWALPHEKFTPPWLYSRAANGSPDFIAVWRRSQTAS